MADVKDLHIPRMGSVENARFIRWIIEEGDAFSKGELLYEIETDKTTTEVEADENGILVQKLAEPNQEFQVGDRIALIADMEVPITDPSATAPAPISQPTEPSPKALNKSISILSIPRMGSVENARFIKWLLKENDTFSKGDFLYEVETDKTVTEIEAESDGILVLQIANEGDEYKVGDGIGLMATRPVSQEEIDGAARALMPPQTTPTLSTNSAVPKTPHIDNSATTNTNSTVQSSPYARRLALERGLDIALITGSGPNGRITGDDVKSHDRSASAPASASRSVDPRLQHLPHSRERHSLRRKTIARRYVETVSRAPHITADMDFDLSAIFNFRKMSKSAGLETPSILGLVAKATADLLVEHVSLNATFTDEDIVTWHNVNLCFAVDTPEGLIVPVIREANKLSALEITQEIANLARQARDKSLPQSALEGGTFTISNPGSIGPVVRAAAILNGPQVALLGLSGIDHRPIATPTDSGGYDIDVKPMLRFSLTHDHRALDGGPVIRFLNALKAKIETPS